MDMLSTLFIIDYGWLKMHHVAYYLQIRHLSHRLKNNTIQTERTFCFIQWIEDITVVDMLMQMILEKLL